MLITPHTPHQGRRPTGGLGAGLSAPAGSYCLPITRPRPRDDNPLVALERVRRVFSPRLFLMQVWMSPRRSQLSAGDCVGQDRNQGPGPMPSLCSAGRGSDQEGGAGIKAPKTPDCPGQSPSQSRAEGYSQTPGAAQELMT